MRRLAVALLAVAVACFAVPGELAAKKKKGDGFFAGGKLIELCRLQGASTNLSMCYGYIFGTMDMAQLTQLSGGRLPWCFPEGMTLTEALKQSMAAMQTYLDTHPQLEQKGAAAVISAALAARFPCSQPSQPSIDAEPMATMDKLIDR